MDIVGELTGAGAGVGVGVGSGAGVASEGVLVSAGCSTDGVSLPGFGVSFFVPVATTPMTMASNTIIPTTSITLATTGSSLQWSDGFLWGPVGCRFKGGLT